MYSTITQQKTETEVLRIIGCIGCGSSNNLRSYNIYDFYSIKNDIYTRNSHRCVNNSNKIIPVCLRCSVEFQRWVRFNSNFKRIRSLSLLYYSLFIACSMFWISNIMLQLLLYGIVALPILFYNLLYLSKVNRMEFNPNTYFDKKKESVKIQGSNDSLKYLDWLKMQFYNKIYLQECKNISGLNYNSENFTFCGECGAKVLKADIKCPICDFYLPLI